MSVEQPNSEPIRPGTEADMDRILEIERLSFEKQWYSDDFRSALNELFLVYQEREVLGFLSACCCAFAKRAVIMRIAVHPDHRGKGVATKLIAAALERLKELSIEEVELDVEIVKKGAIELYEKLGFRTREVITVNGEEESESFLEMTLKLGGE
jgi:ribosomal-protein-alanine N-acetyltransferase